MKSEDFQKVLDWMGTLPPSGPREDFDAIKKHLNDVFNELVPDAQSFPPDAPQ